MGSPEIVWLGTVSFSLYLTHFTVLGLLVWLRIGLGWPDWTYISAVLGIILLTAAVTH